MQLPAKPKPSSCASRQEQVWRPSSLWLLQPFIRRPTRIISEGESLPKSGWTETPIKESEHSRRQERMKMAQLEVAREERRLEEINLDCAKPALTNTSLIRPSR